MWPGSWPDYMALLETDEEVAKIVRHRQFADYFLLQIQVDIKFIYKIIFRESQPPRRLHDRTISS